MYILSITDVKARMSSVMTKQMSDQIIQASHLDYNHFIL